MYKSYKNLGHSADLYETKHMLVEAKLHLVLS